MTRVKICGITNIEDALLASDLGAWALGFIFYKKSPRYVGSKKVKAIIKQLPPFVTPVGVFVNEKADVVNKTADFCGLKVLQFHGEESPAYCRSFKAYRVIKAFRVKGTFDLKVLKPYQVSAYLFDTYQHDQYGGTGQSFDWQLIKSVKKTGIPMILSGGLHIGNLGEAIKAAQPYAVDISSGVESSPGKKSESKLRQLFKNVL